MAKKFDGVIEAVRFKNGHIEVVRAFERRGAAFSDRVLMERHELLKRLKDGRKFVTGKRKEGFGGMFEQGQPVQIVSHDGQEFISTRSDANQDVLEQVPVF
jgi:hypothetical protein